MIGSSFSKLFSLFAFKNYNSIEESADMRKGSSRVDSLPRITRIGPNNPIGISTPKYGSTVVRTPII